MEPRRVHSLFVLLVICNAPLLSGYMQRHFSLGLQKLCEKHESFIMRMILSEKKKKTSFTTWGPTLNQKWLFEGVPRFPGAVMINAAAMSFINVSAVD